MTDSCTGTGLLGLFVVTSELAVHPDGADDLIAAFRNQLRRVENREGFRHLEVRRARPTLIALHRYALIAQ